MTPQQRIFGRSQGGPTHYENARFPGLAWCGVKSQFRHWVRPGTVADVDCPRCLTAIRQDRPRSFRGRR